MNGFSEWYSKKKASGLLVNIAEQADTPPAGQRIDGLCTGTAGLPPLLSATLELSQEMLFRKWRIPGELY